MSLIKLKGKGEIEVSAEDALKVKRIFDDGFQDDDTFIQTEYWSGTKGAIKYVVIDPERQLDDGLALVRAVDDGYRAYRTDKLLIPPEERAKNLSLFSLLYWGFTGKMTATKELMDEAVEIQKQFFQENPKRICCSPILFKPIIRGNNDITVFGQAALDIVERQVNTDMRYQ